MTLSDRETKFCHEYVVDFMGSKAARRAGYSGGSGNAARQYAWKLRQNPEIQALIEDLTADHLEQLGITKERVLREMAAIAFSDVREMLTFDGKVSDPDEWSDETAAAVASYERVSKNSRKIKLWNKTAALEQIAKHLGIVRDNVEHSGEVIVVIGDRDAAGY